MLEINETKFTQIVADAIAETEKTCKTTDNRNRWINAIAKGVQKLEDDPTFIHWQATDKSLLIWSASNEIYSANGVCQCRAYTVGIDTSGSPFPCWHRALARLIRIYMESEEAASPFPQTAKTAAAVSPNIVPTPPLSCNSHCYDLPNGVRNHVSWCEVHRENTRKKFNKKRRDARAA